MPLKVMDVVELRLRVLADVRAGMSVRDAAGLHGTSKTQVYEWLGRYAAEGAQGLVPRSRRPLCSPHQLDAATEDEIVRWRKSKPRWGAKKIRSMLKRAGWRPLPAVSTVHQVLVRRGLVVHVAGSREPAEGWRRFVRPYCNDLWHIDATQHRLRNGQPFWVIDIVDDHSRFLVITHVCVSPTAEAGWVAMRLAVAESGLPRQLISDNGLNFTGRLHGFTVAFERQVRAAGIEFLHARPRHPETIGKLERQHSTQNNWLTDHGAPVSLHAAQALLEAYRIDYNTARPHEAIGQQFPAEVWTASIGIQLPAIELEPADPYPQGCLKRRVKPDGSIVYGHTRLLIDRRWAGITIGALPDHGRLEIYYGAALIDTLSIGNIPAPTPRGRRRHNN